MTPIRGLTWPDVQKRSSTSLGSLDLWCFDCEFHFHRLGVPCPKHVLPEERDEVRARVDDALLRGLR